MAFTAPSERVAIMAEAMADDLYYYSPGTGLVPEYGS
jgi:hypothetical protein